MIDADLWDVHVCVCVCESVCVSVQMSYTRLNYQTEECHSDMAGSHIANSEFKSHQAHRLTEVSHSLYQKKKKKF